MTLVLSQVISFIDIDPVTASQKCYVRCCQKLHFSRFFNLVTGNEKFREGVLDFKQVKMKKFKTTNVLVTVTTIKIEMKYHVMMRYPSEIKFMCSATLRSKYKGQGHENKLMI